MGDIYFRQEDFSNVSLNEGYAKWRNGEGHICSFHGHKARGPIVDGPHWGGRDVGTGGMGNSGRRLIVPVSREARKLVRMHITECWVNRYGISYRQADRLYRFRGSFKFELIEDICAAINDPACHRAMLDFPGIGPGCHHDWFERWGDVVADYCQRSWPRNAGLIEAVAYVVSN